MRKLLLCIYITCTLHPMEQFLMSAIPAAVSGFIGYSTAQNQHHQITEQQSQAYTTLQHEHEQLKNNLIKSGLLLRGTHQVVVCNPLNTLFNRSIENGDEQGMQVVLKTMQDRFNINGFDENGATALHLAARKKNERCMKYLFLHGANPNISDGFDMTPMHYAAQANDIETMTLLITSGADLNIKRKIDGLTPLMAALKANKHEAITFLLALKNKRAEMERAPSPDHSVNISSSLLMALELQKKTAQNIDSPTTCDSLNLIFYAFLERNPECLICFEEMSTNVHIATCCQKGVCDDCAKQLAKKPTCSFCMKPFEGEPFLIYQRNALLSLACSSSSHLSASSS